jgi:hypothetical protein
VVDRGGGRFDFSSVAPLVAAARKNDIDVVWDLFHYGYPSDVDWLSEDFIDRFADYCAACGRGGPLRTLPDGKLPQTENGTGARGTQGYRRDPGRSTRCTLPACRPHVPGRAGQ